MIQIKSAGCHITALKNIFSISFSKLKNRPPITHHRQSSQLPVAYFFLCSPLPGGSSLKSSFEANFPLRPRNSSCPLKIVAGLGATLPRAYTSSLWHAHLNNRVTSSSPVHNRIIKARESKNNASRKCTVNSLHEQPKVQ